MTYALVQVHKDYKPVGYLQLVSSKDAYVVLNRSCATRFYDLAELSRAVQEHNDKCDPGAHFTIVTV